MPPGYFIKQPLSLVIAIRAAHVYYVIHYCIIKQVIKLVGFYFAYFVVRYSAVVIFGVRWQY